MCIKLLDCTLRDGGYVNDWNFGEDNILWIIQKLQNANLDIIEIGYIREKEADNPNRTVYSCPLSTNNILKSPLIKHSKSSLISAMIDYGACGLNNICDKKDTNIDILRVTFRKPQLNEAISYCKELKQKGYTIFLQPVSITAYTDREMLDLIDEINILKPLAVSIVDSYGLMHEEKVIRYFYLMDNNLLPDIALAYHSHNNFQLAYSNSIKLINMNCKRDMYFDTTLYGMGKSAGNCNSELLAMYMNKNCGKNYDLNEILDIIDVQILNFLKQYKWGYQLPFFISASNDCHPNYVNYLLQKNMITIKEINNIVSKISKEKKLVFDKDYLETLYFEHQMKKVDDTKAIETLKEKFDGASIMLLGSGNSISKEYNRIKEFISLHKIPVFSVNHINKFFNSDYIFISNAKRFEQFNLQLKQKNKKAKIITTSNIMAGADKSDFILNWGSLSSKDSLVGTSSLYMLLNLFLKINVHKVVLAGFDGFSKYTRNHYDNNLEFYNPVNNADKITKEINRQLGFFQKHIKLEFLTNSMYNKEKIFV